MVGYNVTVWRVQGGKVISVSVGQFANGRLYRTNGGKTHADGSDAFHGFYVDFHSEWLGKPCDLVVTERTDGFIDALSIGHQQAYKKARQRGAIQISNT